MKAKYSSLYKHSKYQCKISPDNIYIANIVENRLVIRANEMDLAVKEVHESKNPLDYLLWAPDSDHILAVSYKKSQIEIRSITDPRWKGYIYDEGFPFIKVLWSPDSKNILCFSDLNLRLSVWSLSGREQKCIDHLKYSNKGFEISPDKKYAAILEKNNGKEYISIYQSNSFILVQRFEVGTIDVENLKWSPNSKYIAVWDVCLYYKVLVYRLDGKQCLDYSGDEFGLGIRTLQWSPDSEIIALGDYDDNIVLIYAISWEFIGSLVHASSYSSSSAGPNILEEVDLNYNQVVHRPFQLPIRRPEYNIANPRKGIQTCLFSPNGKLICSKSDTIPSALFIWELKSLSCLHIIVFEKPIKQVVWNPHEEYIMSVICGDENIRYIELDQKSNILDITPSRASTNGSGIEKIKWNKEGNSLLVMEKDLFCVSALKVDIMQ